MLLYVFFFIIIQDYSNYDYSSDLENPQVVKLGISQIKWFDILFGMVGLDVLVLESEYSGKCWLVIAFLTGAFDCWGVDAGGTWNTFDITV